MTHRPAIWACLLVTALSVAWTGCAGREPRIHVLPPVLPPEAYEPPAAPALPAPAVSAAAPSSGDAGTTGSAGAAIVRAAMGVLGAPYRDGGAQPDGFDCSGLVSYVFGRSGIAVPRDVRQQAASGQAVPRAAILPGDLLFFSTTGPGPTHVGIAIGGDRFIHAPRSGAAVRIESLASAYWTTRLLAARRLVLGSDLENRHRLSGSDPERRHP